MWNGVLEELKQLQMGILMELKMRCEKELFKVHVLSFFQNYFSISISFEKSSPQRCKPKMLAETVNLQLGV